MDGGAWEPLAATGRKEYLDATLPLGASAVKYQVRAVRSTLSGIAAEFQVRLGSRRGNSAAAAVRQAA